MYSCISAAYLLSHVIRWLATQTGHLILTGVAVTYQYSLKIVNSLIHQKYTQEFQTDVGGQNLDWPFTMRLGVDSQPHMCYERYG